MVVTFIALAVLGLIFGSFVNALVWRTHRQLPILSGRSQCPHCGHKLAAKDLIPVLSWFVLRGRCRYCGQPISWRYPITELAGAVIFVGSYSFWPGGVYGIGDWLLLTTWLATSVGLLALLTYDFKWMLLPNHILYPTLVVAVAGRLIYILSFEPQKSEAAISWALSVLVASGVFWLIFMASSGKLIGYGDVRLGLITGTLLADPLKSLLVIFLASLLGTVFALPALIRKKSTMRTKLPYGPFLILATLTVGLFGQDVIDWYQRLLT